MRYATVTDGLPPSVFATAGSFCHRGFTPTCAKNVGFQTGHQKTPPSRTVARSAFPPSQDARVDSSGLNDTCTRLNGGIKLLFAQTFNALEVSHV